MLYRFLLILLPLLTGLRATGQPVDQPAGPNPVVVTMLRATVEFLATDTKQFKSVVDPVCQPCQTYDELSRFAARNTMPGVDDLIADTRDKAQKALNTDPATMPVTLKQYLLGRVVNDPKRSYRAQLAGYAAYEQQLDALANAATDPPTAPEEFVQSETPDDTNQADAYTFTPPLQPTEPHSPMDILPILALLLSALSLAGVVVLWFRKPAVSTQPTILPDDKINRLANKVLTMEKDNRRLQDDLITLQKSVDKLKAAPQSQRTNQPAATFQPPVQPAKTMAASEPLPPRPAAAIDPAVPLSNLHQNPIMLYGRTADLGDGFSVRGLLEKPDRDTIFELVRTDATHATFQVSENLGLQQLALSDAYSYLNDTCIYATQPKPGNRIRTEKPGTLSLQGEKWVITDKAQISFLG